MKSMKFTVVAILIAVFVQSSYGGSPWNDIDLCNTQYASPNLRLALRGMSNIVYSSMIQLTTRYNLAHRNIQALYFDFLNKYNTNYKYQAKFALFDINGLLNYYNSLLTNITTSNTTFASGFSSRNILILEGNVFNGIAVKFNASFDAQKKSIHGRWTVGPPAYNYCWDNYNKDNFCNAMKLGGAKLTAQINYYAPAWNQLVSNWMTVHIPGIEATNTNIIRDCTVHEKPNECFRLRFSQVIGPWGAVVNGFYGKMQGGANTFYSGVTNGFVPSPSDYQSVYNTIMACYPR